MHVVGSKVTRESQLATIYTSNFTKEEDSKQFIFMSSSKNFFKILLKKFLRLLASKLRNIPCEWHCKDTFWFKSLHIFYGFFMTLESILKINFCAGIFAKRFSLDRKMIGTLACRVVSFCRCKDPFRSFQSF